MPSAQFSINSDVPNQGFDATDGQLLSFALRSSQGVGRWVLQVFDADAFDPEQSIEANPPRQSTGATELVLDNGAGGTGQLVTAVNVAAAITATLPSGEVSAWIVRSIVNNGVTSSGRPDPALIAERMVVIRDANANRDVVPTERTQYHDDGWTEAIGDIRETAGTGGGGNDPNAVHVNVAGEIAGVALKATPTGADHLLIEDAADANNKKRILASTVLAGADPDAVHVNVAGEIAAVTAKATPVAADLLLIEDSEDSNNKKRVEVGNLPGGGGGRIGDLGLEFSPTFLWNGNGGLADESGNGNDLVNSFGDSIVMDITPGSRGLFADDTDRHESPSSAVFQHLGDVTLTVIFKPIFGAVYADEGFVVTCSEQSNIEADNALYGFRIKSRGAGGYSLEWFHEQGLGSNVTYEVTDDVLIQQDQVVQITAVRAANQVQFYANRNAFGAISPVLAAPTGGTAGRIRIPGFDTPELAAILKTVKVSPVALNASQVLEEYDRGLGQQWGT